MRGVKNQLDSTPPVHFFFGNLWDLAVILLFCVAHDPFSLGMKGKKFPVKKFPLIPNWEFHSFSWGE